MAIGTWIEVSLGSDNLFSHDERLAICAILQHSGCPRYYCDGLYLGSVIGHEPPDEALTADLVTLFCESQKEAFRVRRAIYAALGPDKYGFRRRGFLGLTYDADDPFPARLS